MRAIIEDSSTKHINPKGYYEPWDYIDTKEYEQCTIKILLQQDLNISHNPARIIIEKGKLLIVARMDYPNYEGDADWYIIAIKSKKLRKRQLIRFYQEEKYVCSFNIAPTYGTYYKPIWANKRLKVTTKSLIANYPWLLSLLRGLWELLLTHSEKEFLRLKLSKLCEDWHTYFPEECLDYMAKEINTDRKMKKAKRKYEKAQLAYHQKHKKEIRKILDAWDSGEMPKEEIAESDIPF